jgi:hypothetical protein
MDKLRDDVVKRCPAPLERLGSLMPVVAFAGVPERFGMVGYVGSPVSRNALECTHNAM